MLNEKGTRELCYIIKISEIRPIAGRDRVECAVVGGWTVMVRKGQFKPGDLGIYLEIDSRAPEKEPFMFLESKHFKIKTQKYKTPDGQFWSQGLLMSADDFGWTLYTDGDGTQYIHDPKNNQSMPEGTFLTEKLGITYAVAEDNARKANSADKYKKMAQRNGKLFAHQPFRWLMRRDWGKKLLFVFFGRKRDRKAGWPVGVFPGVSKTDQERCENMPWILNDKTPYIVTQKCDGSSGTFILEKKPFGYEFYVCSRNVRMIDENQESFYKEKNYYWEVANKYHIQEKMKKYLNDHPGMKWICWQGEICAPGIQKNPQHLTETHLFCFHWTDNINGRRDIREAAKDWESMSMEVVPIVDTNYIMPDDFEQFKVTADGYYNSEVCEGYKNCPREGFVYYKTTDPTFSFKNVSRQYLLRNS